MTLSVRPLPRTAPLTHTESLVDHDGGAPLRCCLRDSRPGERLTLGLVSPPGPAGPYAESGPVFVHADPCAGPADDGYPDAFRSRAQVLRAYDADGRIIGGEIVEPGRHQEQVAERLLADPQVSFLHSHNVVYGCYMFRIERRRGEPSTRS